LIEFASHFHDAVHRLQDLAGGLLVTAPAAVIEQCFKHPLTDIGLERFLKDWEKAQAAKV